MAGEIPDLVALERTGTGKGAARQARRDGMVPGIVFGGDKEPLPIQIPFNVLFKRLKAGRFKSTLWNLKVEGHDDVRVICRDVQRDVIKDLPTHLDLMRLRRTTKIALFIPVEFINEGAAPGIKKGGVLTVVRPEVELMCTAGDIPEKITVEPVHRVVQRCTVIIFTDSGCSSFSFDFAGSPEARRARSEARVVRANAPPEPRRKRNPGGYEANQQEMDFDAYL